MKITDLNASFVGAGGEGISIRGPDGKLISAPERSGVGVSMDCPCGCDDRLFAEFVNPIDGGETLHPKGWKRTGDTLENLTLSPSLQRVGVGVGGTAGSKTVKPSGRDFSQGIFAA